MAEIVCNIKVCVCCMLIHANGECGGDHDHTGGDDSGWGPEPLSLIEPGYTVTMGLLASEHNEECEVFKTGSWPANYECDCERDTFSKSRCDGCGSYLHGERYAFTLWKEDVKV